MANALVSGASVLYSDDAGLAKFAAGCGLAVKKVADLPVPASQQVLEFPEPVGSRRGGDSGGESDGPVEAEGGAGQAPVDQFQSVLPLVKRI